jgi:hypothetical protein
MDLRQIRALQSPQSFTAIIVDTLAECGLRRLRRQRPGTGTDRAAIALLEIVRDFYLFRNEPRKTF